MTNELKRKMFEAAAWTFLETFFATLAPALAVVNVGDWHALVGIAASAGIGALAAAISLLKSYLVRNLSPEGQIFISELGLNKGCDDPDNISEVI